MPEKKELKYAVRGFRPGRPGEPPHLIVWEYLNGFPIWEYTGYDKKTYLTLYPKRQLAPNTLGHRKLSVNIRDTVREY